MEESQLNTKLTIFKNKHLHQKGVIMGTGATLNDYVEIEGAIHFGVNSIAEHKHADLLDYYFITDRNTSPSTYINRKTNKGKTEILNLRCTKFFGKFKHANTLWRNSSHICLTDADIEENNALVFEIGCKKLGTFPNLIKDIDVYCFGGFQSVIWYALQFALFTGISELYIVGCDIDNSYYGNTKVNNKSTHLISFWKKAKHFINTEYPNVKVVVVNPKGLKDVFDTPDFLTRCDSFNSVDSFDSEKAIKAVKFPGK